MPRHPNLTTEQRFWTHVDPCRTDGCMIWLAAQDLHGYGKWRVQRKTLFAYHFLSGKAPKGLEWDHLCKIRQCVNPEHLEAVTHLVNMRRGTAGAINKARLAARTHCIYGHELVPENIYYMSSGKRQCKACSKRKNHEYARRKANAAT